MQRSELERIWRDHVDSLMQLEPTQAPFRPRYEAWAGEARVGRTNARVMTKMSYYPKGVVVLFTTEGIDAQIWNPCCCGSAALRTLTTRDVIDEGENENG